MAFRRSQPDSSEDSAEPSDPRPPAKWEFKAIDGMGPQHVSAANRQQLEETLNSLARDGWEVVGNSGSVIILRRDVIGASDVSVAAVEATEV